MLKEKREKKGLTQSELAKKVGLSENYLSALENRPQDCNPTLDTIGKLAKELDICPEELFEFLVDKITE
jgi:transcriptional regulator with XRE-family HTH domain